LPLDKHPDTGMSWEVSEAFLTRNHDRYLPLQFDNHF